MNNKVGINFLSLRISIIYWPTWKFWTIGLSWMLIFELNLLTTDTWIVAGKVKKMDFTISLFYF